MEAVYENWYDYEMNGKVPFSLIESQFNEEYDNFIKMMNAIDVCDESGVATISINENTITDKIKELWHKFTLLLNSIVNKVKEQVAAIQAKMNWFARQREALKHIDWDKVARDYDKRYTEYIQSNQDVFDAEYVVIGEGVSSINEGIYKGQYLGLVMNGTMITDTASIIKIIDSIYISSGLLKTVNIINTIVSKADDENALIEVMGDIDTFKNTVDQKIKDSKKSVGSLFAPNYEGNPKGYCEYLDKHAQEIGKAVVSYQKEIENLKQLKEKAEKEYDFLNKSLEGKASSAMMKVTSVLVGMMSKKIKIYSKLISLLKKDLGLSIMCAKVTSSVAGKENMAG